MLNPLPLIWRAEPVQLPPAPLTASGIELLRAGTRRNAYYIGDYPTCFGFIESDSLRLRLAAVPTNTFPPWLRALRASDGEWTATFQRTLVDRLWLTGWFAMIVVVIAFAALGAFKEYPDPIWISFALGCIGVSVFYLVMIALLRWESVQWNWQKARLEAFLAEGFREDRAV